VAAGKQQQQQQQQWGLLQMTLEVQQMYCWSRVELSQMCRWLREQYC
jgi:hypothetical protein